MIFGADGFFEGMLSPLKLCSPTPREPVLTCQKKGWERVVPSEGQCSQTQV